MNITLFEQTMTNRKKYYFAVIVASTLVITFLHYTTNRSTHAMHDIYRQLYYIPLLMGALVFGLRGAAFTYAFVLILYLPYMVGSWTGPFLFDIKRVLFLLFSAIFSFIAGILVDRDKMREEQLGKERYLAGLGRAASAIVHDLKNPLLSVQAFARRIRDGKGDSCDATSVILDSAAVMESIVGDVLDFAGPIHVDLKEEDVQNIVGKVCELSAHRASERGITVSEDYSGEPIMILMDRSRMQRALMNLVNNAIEASGCGQKVVVSTVMENNSVRITIRDNGSGMDKETLENIFMPFYTKKSTGTGLGMPIAMKIIEGHEGKLQIQSKPTVGTEVVVSLPIRRPVQALSILQKEG